MQVGDCHITRGATFVIGGAPGIGKSRSAVALAIAGATGQPWFGLETRRQFRTMIIQTENGLFRRSRDFADLPCDDLEEWLRVCPPPPFGLCFDREDFCATLSAEVTRFQPDVVVLDPWNAAARDEKARQYLETYETIRALLPTGDERPALGIVAHTRKPTTDERAAGRGLLKLLVGSYVLGSVPRSVFIMQAASDEPDDKNVVWTCAKNNDGEMGQRSVWERRNGLFAPVSDFDWKAFDNAGQRDKMNWRSVAGILKGLGGSASRAAIVEALEEDDVAEATAYRWITQATKNKRIIMDGTTGDYKLP
jgi:AAA domain